MDVRERLSRHLYKSALSLDPVPAPALRLFHDDGLTWSIKDGFMSYSIANSPDQEIELSGSVLDLQDILEASGVTILFADAAMQNMPSNALLERDGSSASSTSNSLLMFSSPLWTMLDAYGLEINEADVNLLQAIDQLYLNTADGEILDVWGEKFGVPRETSELDQDYYARIIAEVLRPRNTRYAIQNAITDLTGFLVTLREPYREIFKLDFSALSDSDHFQDGVFFTWNVFQPIYHSVLSVEDRNRVLAIIHRNRPAGSMIVGEFVRPPIGYASGSFGTNTLSNVVAVFNLGEMDFAEPFDTFYFQWTLLGDVTYLFGSDAPLGICEPLTWSAYSWNDMPWKKGSVSAVVTQI